MPTCKYCSIIKPTSSAVKKHIQLTLTCRDRYLAELTATTSSAANAEHCAPEDINVDGELGRPVNEVSENSYTADDTRIAASQEEVGHSAWNVPVEWP
jgi:hypothetical protein